MLLNFKENPNEKPVTSGEAHDLVFGTVNDFYKENSFGQTWFSGQVVGWYTLPLSNQECNFLAVQDAADQKAIASGIVLSNFDRIVYLMTKTACTSSGQGTMQGSPTRAWINGNFSAKTTAHELGHNLGLYHSRALDCGAKAIGEQCKTLEYGDTYDAMGGPDIGYFNTFQKERLGWLEGAHAAKTIEVTQSGTYSIANYETQTNQPVTIKVPRGIDSTTGKKSWFYIEYRQSVGFDDFLDARSYRSSRDDVTAGIIVRSAIEGDGRSSNLLHFKPEPDSSFNDWFDPALSIGGSFTDPVSGVSFSLVSANGSLAEVKVTLDDSGSGGDNGSCAINAPSINAQAITGSSVFAGAEVQYQVTVTNKDSADCASASFDISTAVPFGWQVTNDRVTLAPGASGQVVIAVTSAQEATAKDYSLSIKATHGSDSAYSAATSVRYTVVADESTAPAVVAVDDSVALSAKVSVVIDVLANDMVDAQASASVTSFTQPNKGSVELLSDGTLRYTPGRRFKNNDSFSYTISDGNTRSTAYVSVRLQSDGGSNTGPGKGKNK
ncbi:Ig-like domain-containing protein [Pseudoalteromonas sp. T1lg22]|uniref:Ig-like domain-containing protein n=1 Tax=Pseudoalteromonas sp. T1lg22 TaxID=2077096 RepID=UPI0018F875E9|nr:Ig-like domain-containing protein [Pseudoalteromonas sp. T1lg22]